MINATQNGASSIVQGGERVRVQSRPQEQTEIKVDAEVENFLQILSEGGGTGSSIQRINLEKIEKIIEEKKLELLEKYGLNEGAKNAPQGEAYTTAMESMHKELSDFIKQLMEQLAIKDGIKKEPGGLVPRGSLISAVA